MGRRPFLLERKLFVPQRDPEQCTMVPKSVFSLCYSPIQSQVGEEQTLNQLSALNVSFLVPQLIHDLNSEAYIDFSASSTNCQSNESDLRKAARSSTSSDSKRFLNKANSDLTNLARRSGLHRVEVGWVSVSGEQLVQFLSLRG